MKKSGFTKTDSTIAVIAFYLRDGNQVDRLVVPYDKSADRAEDEAAKQQQREQDAYYLWHKGERLFVYLGRCLKDRYNEPYAHGCYEHWSGTQYHGRHCLR